MSWGGGGGDLEWGGRDERAYNDARREMTSLTIFVLCVLLLLQTIYTAVSVPLWHFVYQLFLHLAFLYGTEMQNFRRRGVKVVR